MFVCSLCFFNDRLYGGKWGLFIKHLTILPRERLLDWRLADASFEARSVKVGSNSVLLLEMINVNREHLQIAGYNIRPIFTFHALKLLLFFLELNLLYVFCTHHLTCPNFFRELSISLYDLVHENFQFLSIFLLFLFLFRLLLLQHMLLTFHLLKIHLQRTHFIVHLSQAVFGLFHK
mgnify:CR=1 FL=1